MFPYGSYMALRASTGIVARRPSLSLHGAAVSTVGGDWGSSRDLSPDVIEIETGKMTDLYWKCASGRRSPLMHAKIR